MRPVKIALATLVALVAVSTTIWSARYAASTTRQTSKETSAERHWREMKEGADRFAGRVPEGDASQPLDPAVERRPGLAETGLLPKAVVVGKPFFEFGRMGTNEERTHVFRIENKGPGPLVIAKGPTECKCTISKLSNHRVDPGQSAEIEIEWTTREARSDFRQDVDHLDE